MTQKISTIIITEQTGTLEVLKLYLEEFGSFNFLASTTDYSKAYNAIKELDKSLVIVDISEYPDPGLNFISKVSHEFPGCRIIALSDRPAVDLVVKVMRAGAKEFLSLPLIKNELFEVLAYTFQDLTGQHKKKNKCRVLTVFSNKGGYWKNFYRFKFSIGTC